MTYIFIIVLVIIAVIICRRVDWSALVADDPHEDKTATFLLPPDTEVFGPEFVPFHVGLYKTRAVNPAYSIFDFHMTLWDGKKWRYPEDGRECYQQDRRFFGLTQKVGK